MSDAAIVVIAILLGVTLMFVFPLMTTADKKDDISTLNVQTAVTEFVNNARTTGEITRTAYDNLVYALAATGEAYNVEITVQKIDGNYAKKQTSGDATVIGDNVYLTDFNTQVMSELNNNDKYIMKEGDIITVSAINISKTIATQLKNIWYKVTGNETGNIAASASGMVTTTASGLGN